ncbi:MAG: SDR family NAD(P)-dependent oxidoreductase [Deltaproteobacteria bacterium]
MNIRTLKGKTALVTGAGSGIGKATALALAGRGADLVLCDVSQDGLDATRLAAEALGRSVLARRVDVASAGEMESFANEVHRGIEAVDILVNNAGVGLGGTFLETGLDDWNWIVGINLFGVVHGCRFFVPAMVERGRGGHVVNLSSLLGYSPTPGVSAYCATKFAVLGFSQVLRSELKDVGIGVTAVCPGIINTNIVQSSRLRGEAGKSDSRQRTAALYAKRNYGPERVASNILKAIARNRAVAPVSPESWFMYYTMRFLPRLGIWLNGKMTASVLEL